MSEERWEIPSSWSWTKAGDFARVVGGGTPSSKIEGNFSNNGIPWVTPADLTGYQDSHISRGRRNLSEEGFANCGAQLIPAGSVLFSSRAPIGYCVIARNEISTNQGFKSLVLEGGIQPEYIRYYLLSAKEYAESKASGTTFLELSGARVAELSLPVAPLPEQRRIVEKVDSLTASTARARKELDRIPTLIARYKQRLLALAFAGELFSDLNGEAVFEPRAFEEAILSTFYGPRFGKDAYVADGVPTLRTTDFDSAGNVSPKDPPRVAVLPEEYAKWGLSDGDLLVTRTGSIGKCALYSKETGPALPSAYLIRVRLDQAMILPKYALLFLLSGEGQRQLGAGITAVAQPNINAKVISGLQLAIPSLEIQSEIVRRIESAFGWIDRMAGEHTSATKLLPKLDAAILAKAFQGRLVSQDPDDEPASVLLAKIKAQRAELRDKPKKSKGEKSKGTIVESHAGPMRAEVVRPRKTVKVSAMSKSRRDDDIWQQPYLAKLLKSKRVNDPQALFKLADLPVADFYKQLAWEIDNGHIIDDTEKLKAA